MENTELKGGRYTFLKWNGKDGLDARFVVQDSNTGKQAIFIPGRVQDLVWTRMKISEDSSIKSWEDFGNESVDDLEGIAF